MDVVERAKALRKQIEDNAAQMSDCMAMEYKELFPEWNADGVTYKTGNRVKYDGTIYRVIQDHVSQAKWTPDTAESLFVKVAILDTETITERE